MAAAAPTATRAEQVWPWLFPFDTGHVSQWYNPPVEYGVDIALPVGTPITSLVDGQVLDVGYPSCPGGVVSIECVIYGQVVSHYVQHMDLLVVQPGDQVHVGQLLGYSGGQLSGGHHPAERLCSEGPHIEIGINAPWGGVWHALGKNMDPTPWLRALIANGPGISAVPFIGSTLAAGRGLSRSFAPGFEGIAQAIHYHETFQPAPPFQPSLNPLSDGIQLARNAGTFFVTNLEAATIRLLVIAAGVLIILMAMWAVWLRIIQREAEIVAGAARTVAPAAGAFGAGAV